MTMCCWAFSSASLVWSDCCFVTLPHLVESIWRAYRPKSLVWSRRWPPLEMIACCTLTLAHKLLSSRPNARRTCQLSTQVFFSVFFSGTNRAYRSNDVTVASRKIFDLRMSKRLIMRACRWRSPHVRFWTLLLLGTVFRTCLSTYMTLVKLSSSFKKIFGHAFRDIAYCVLSFRTLQAMPCDRHIVFFKNAYWTIDYHI